MANAAWPGSLPSYVLVAGYKETLPKNAIETNMEAGPVKARRRFTMNYRQFQCTMKMDSATATIFEAFYQTTLAGGTLPFDWVHPVTRATATFRFRQPPPSYGIEGATTRVANFALEQLA